MKKSDRTIYLNGRFLTQRVSGVQRFAFETAIAFIKQYNGNVIVLTPPMQLQPEYSLDHLNIKVVGKNKGAIWEQLDLPLFLRRNNKELLINLTNTAPLLYHNQVVGIMDMTTFINPAWFTKRFARYYQFIVPLMVKRSKKIVTISQCSKKDIIKYTKIGTDKVEVVYCAVTEKFKKDYKPRLVNGDILEKLRIQKHGFFLAVSSLDPRKNFVRLVSAYKEVCDSNYPLVIVGSEGKVFANNELKALISQSNNVVFTGYISDDELSVLYRCAYGFIYPSFYEGFGMPPLEAMSCGCPTIVSNTSSLPEVCGDASIYVDPEDNESIKNAILKLIDDKVLREQLIVEGNLQASKFSWENVGAKLVEVVLSVL